MKIKEKLFFMIFSVVILIAGGIYIIGEFYLEKFYIKSKVENLKSISDIVKDPKYIINLDELEREENIIVYIKPFTAESIYEDLSREDVERFQREGVADRLKSGENIVKRMRVSSYEGEYIILYTRYSADSLLEIRTPISSITEAVEISNKYYLRLISIVMLFGVFLAIYFSKKITDPIISLKQITYEISELNFDRKFTEKRSDELGELGSSINKMGDMLEENGRARGGR